jgi:hypothetical protein
VSTDIVIDDLSAPRFSPEVASMLELAGPMAEVLELSEEAILGQACQEVGLDDFGDDRFRAPLAALLRAARQEAGLSAFGTISVHSQLVQLAKNRLLITDLLRRHPEIHEIPIVAPIIIAGLPRTGTTHLHNLLSADPALRSLPYWESVEPVAGPGEVAGPDGVDPRWGRTKAAVDFLDAAMPHFKAMHEMTADHVHEEIQLLAIDFSSMLFETLALMPSYRDFYKSEDQTPHYQYLRTVLQVLTFLRGGSRWVLKSPQHLEQFAVLRSVFPDATVAVTHRDPVAVTASMLTMLAYTARLQVTSPDPVAIGSYWSSRLEDLLLGCVRDRELLDPEHSMDVEFTTFMADDLGLVARIYHLAGQPLDDQARRGHADYVAGHARNRHGRIHYELETFGIDPDERRDVFDAYYRRFGVRREGRGAG